MSDAATPTETQVQTPPATPVATPAETQPESTPVVTLSKEEHEQLARDAARARANQSKADRYDRMVSKGHFNNAPQAPATPSPEDAAERASVEDRKAERGLLAMASDPKYRPLFDADPTLREMIVSNPLAVLPIYASDALDADDALALISEKFGERLTKLQPPATPPAPETPTAPPATPPAGAINASEELPNQEYEAASKHPVTENAIAGMVQAKLRSAGGKSS